MSNTSSKDIPLPPRADDRRRVMLVCPVGEGIGGAEQVMLALGREMPKHGFEPILVAMRAGRLAGIAREQGIEAYEFREHRYRQLLVVRQARIWLTLLMRQEKISLVHSTHTAHLYGGPAARRAGAREVWHLHDPPAPRDWVEALTRRIPTDHAIFTTAHVAAAFPSLQKGPHSIIAPSCIDPNRLRQLPTRPDTRARLGLPTGPLLLTVARLQSHKGHADLIAASAIVLKARPDAVFAIVGRAGTPDQERYHSELAAQCIRLGVADRVRLVGFVDDSDLATLYRDAVALVHPAHSEGYGLVLLEAMGMSVPVIAAAASGPSEFVETDTNGILVPPHSPPALADAIIRLLSDQPLHTRLQAGGLVTSQRLTIDEMTRQVVNVYRRVLAVTSK